ncbi:hypothetical protein AVEN_119539-1 [Araneus ventricosus]|uniref:Uncharacterized protein n=1 Tax=Araneus ventricosus TaxID=182803 RepID=A0A4Y2JBF8_ARAVE|nr:hypothetical protein AVEN_119539-1 [Araneus ventricosus]
MPLNEKTTNLPPDKHLTKQDGESENGKEISAGNPTIGTIFSPLSRGRDPLKTKENLRPVPIIRLHLATSHLCFLPSLSCIIRIQQGPGSCRGQISEWPRGQAVSGSPNPEEGCMPPLRPLFME